MGTKGEEERGHKAAGSHGAHRRQQERTGSERDTDGVRRKRYDIYLRERREKNTTETRKSV